MEPSLAKSPPSRQPGSMLRRIGWFIGIWAASIVVVAAVAEGLKHIILG